MGWNCHPAKYFILTANFSKSTAPLPDFTTQDRLQKFHVVIIIEFAGGRSDNGHAKFGIESDMKRNVSFLENTSLHNLFLMF